MMLKPKAMLVLSVLSLVTVAGTEYTPVPLVTQSLAQAVKANTIKNGDDAFGAKIGTKFYDGVWSFFYIKSGEKPENFQLVPMYAFVKEDNVVSREVSFRSSKNNSFVFISPYGYIFRLTDGHGLGFSFKNPFDRNISIEYEGALRLYGYDPASPTSIFLFKGTLDGKKILLKSSSEPDAIYAKENILKNGSKKVTYYFRLGVDVELTKNEMVFLVVIESAKPPKNPIRFCIDEGINIRSMTPYIIIK